MQKRRIKKKYKVMLIVIAAVAVSGLIAFSIKLINQNKPEEPAIEYGQILEVNALEGDKK